MTRNRLGTHAPLGLLLIGFLGTIACSIKTASADDAIATGTSDLKAAQCDFQSFKASAEACFTTYHTCAIADGAVIDDCRAALKTCLPPPPHEGEGGKGGGPSGPPAASGSGSGDRPPPPAPPGSGSSSGGPPGPAPSGSAGGPPPGPPPGGSSGGPPGGGPPGGGRDGGAAGPGGGPPGGGGGCHPEPAAVRACHEALLTSLEDASADVTAALETERACVKAAFHAAFQAKCDEMTARCAKGDGDASKCAELTARCSSDVDGPPDRPGDKDTCSSTAAAAPSSTVK